jgi:hypothetical protein
MKTDPRLAVSVVLNGILLAVAGYLVGQRATPVQSLSRPQSESVEANTEAESRPAVAPLRWSQVSVNPNPPLAESGLHSRAESLAAVAQNPGSQYSGSPFSTARTSPYSSGSATVLSAPASYDAAAPSEAAVQPFQNPGEMGAVGYGGSIAGANGQNPPAAKPAQVPLAFMDPNPAAPPLNPVQQVAVAQLRNTFVADVGGQNQDPSDPQYAANWQTAQQSSDQRMRAQLGTQAYLQYAFQRDRQALAAGTPSH